MERRKGLKIAINFELMNAVTFSSYLLCLQLKDEQSAREQKVSWVAWKISHYNEWL